MKINGLELNILYNVVKNNMKNLQFITLISTFLLLISCGSSVKFPVSDLAPAAEITAQQKEDKNGNTKIEINANYLANPNRLSPPKSFYVVWGLTENGEVKNIGRLKQTGNKKVSLETTTPYEIEEVFITAEDEGNINYPSKTEITRKRL